MSQYETPKLLLMQFFSRQYIVRFVLSNKNKFWLGIDDFLEPKAHLCSSSSSGGGGVVHDLHALVLMVNSTMIFHQMCPFKGIMEFSKSDIGNGFLCPILWNDFHGISKVEMRQGYKQTIYLPTHLPKGSKQTVYSPTHLSKCSKHTVYLPTHLPKGLKQTLYLPTYLPK